MTKRMLDCCASDFATMGKRELLESIAGAEGRTIVCETIGSIQPMLGNVTNAEFAAAMGADIILLNMLDLQNPTIRGLPPGDENPISLLKKLTGRKLGVNMEPADPSLYSTDGLWAMTPGRLATAENAKRAVELGIDLIVLTGNPGNGVSNTTIEDALKLLRPICGDKVALVAGRMHASGVLSEAGSQMITPEDIRRFVAAGADIILLPAPCTVPGITAERVGALVEVAHSLGALAMTAIGTSQEGADTDTIRRIALLCKGAGADLHHIGDAGYGGIALPENIFAYSVAVRGVRHTYTRMARSINR